ncbi:MAG: DUF5916 domain-containing protein [Gemmatimonadota bacterium]
MNPRLLLLLLLAIPVGVRAQGTPQAPAPSVKAPRIEADVTIDGVLDEPVWQQAARLDGFHQTRPVDGRPAEDSTVVLVWYSPTAIHFGILAYDRDPSSVRATLAKRDNIASDDQVSIYLDTFNDRRRAYFFGSNAYGVQDDGVRSEGGFSASAGMISGTIDRNPDFLWQSKGQKTSFGYVIEMRIPFKSLRYAGGAEQTWGINIARTTQRTGYEDTWTDTRRANASFLTQAGTLTGIHDIKRGVVTELQPTVTANYPGTRDANGNFARGDLKTDFGGNVRLGFTNITLDGTINPDFSQVESDAGLVTINERFALFFPERRPFFLEGIELFAAPNNLVYTRSIVNPLAGAKLTGKFGHYTVAQLNAIDEVSNAANAFVNMTRVRRDVGANSVAGLTLTDREQDGAFNRVLSADTRLVFKKLYYFQSQLANSWTRDASTGDTRSAPLWDLELDRTGRGFGFNYHLTGTSDAFEARSGFVNRTGITQGRAFNRWSFYGARGTLIEQVTVFGGGTRIWNYGDFVTERAIEGTNEANLSLRLRGGWNISGKLGTNFARFDPASYSTYAVQGPGGPAAFALASGVFDQWSGSASVNSPLFRQFDASISTNLGRTAIFPEAAEGSYTTLRGSLNLRPTPGTRLSGTVTWTRLKRVADGSEFARTVIPRVKLELQPNRAFFFRLVGEYRSERQAALRDPATGFPILINGALAGATRRNQLRMDWLASYEPTPGTVAFLGYGSTLEGDRSLTLQNLRRLDDAFFLKLAYLFRR